MKDRFGEELEIGDTVVFLGPYLTDPMMPNYVIGETGTVRSFGKRRVRVRLNDSRHHGRVLSPTPGTVASLRGLQTDG